MSHFQALEYNACLPDSLSRSRESIIAHIPKSFFSGSGASGASMPKARFLSAEGGEKPMGESELSLGSSIMATAAATCRLLERGGCVLAGFAVFLDDV